MAATTAATVAAASHAAAGAGASGRTRQPPPLLLPEARALLDLLGGGAFCHRVVKLVHPDIDINLQVRDVLPELLALVLSRVVWPAAARATVDGDGGSHDARREAMLVEVGEAIGAELGKHAKTEALNACTYYE